MSVPVKTTKHLKTYLTSGDHDDDAALQDFAGIDGAAAAAVSAEEEKLRAEGGHATLAAQEEVALPATLHVAYTHRRYKINMYCSSPKQSACCNEHINYIFSGEITHQNT